eukprot:UN10957
MILHNASSILPQKANNGGNGGTDGNNTVDNKNNTTGSGGVITIPAILNEQGQLVGLTPEYQQGDNNNNNNKESEQQSQQQQPQQIFVIPPMELKEKQRIYKEHLIQLTTHMKQTPVPVTTQLLQTVLNAKDKNNWERGFIFKVESYSEFVVLYNMLRSRLMSPEMLSRYKEFA